MVTTLQPSSGDRPAAEPTRARVLLALESPLLNDTLRQLIADDPAVEVVGAACDPADVLIAAVQHRANVVVHPWPATGQVPAICSHLFAADPEVTIIGIGAGGAGNVCCRQTIVTEVLPTTSLECVRDAIRSAGLRAAAA